MKKGILYIFILSLSISLFAFGCGTIFNGTSDIVTINSTPSNAKVSISNDKGVLVSTGNTPITKKLSKKSDYSVTINLNGYKEQVVYVNSSLNALYLIGDIFCGGLIGVAVDAITGGWNDLEPSSIKITLETAYNENNEDVFFTVFTIKDENGQLQQWKVPLQKN